MTRPIVSPKTSAAKDEGRLSKNFGIGRLRSVLAEGRLSKNFGISRL